METSQDTLQSVHHKIKALLRLAEKSTFPEESANALGKAQALMLKYKLSVSELEYAETAAKEIVQEFRSSPLNEEDSGKKKLASWKYRLGTALAKANGVFLYTSDSRLILTGMPSNVDTLRYLYAYCVKQIDSITLANCKGQGHTYANNFRFGCIDAISKAIRAEQQAVKDAALRTAQAANDNRALIVVQNSLARIDNEHKDAERFARATHKFVSRNHGQSRGDNTARAHGQQAGSGIYSGKASGRIGPNNKRLT